MNKKSILLSLTILTTSAFSLPHTFNSGDIINASDMNDNFASVEALANKKIVFTDFAIEKQPRTDVSLISELVTVECPAGSKMVYASASCIHSAFTSSSVNLGQPFTSMIGDSALSYCLVSWESIVDRNKPSPPITVFYRCTEGTTAARPTASRSNSISKNKIEAIKEQYKILDGIAQGK